MASSSSSRYQIVATNGKDTKCNCGFERFERTTWIADNPARCFWNFPNSLIIRLRNCRYFRWKDDELLDPYYRQKLLSLKQQLDRKEDASELIKSRKRIHMLEVIRAKEKFEFEKELLKLRSDNASLKRLLDIAKIVFTILVVGLGICVFKI